MDTLVPYLRAQQLTLVLAPSRILKDLMLACIAKLSLTSEVWVLDGGNQFDPYPIARQVRRMTREMQPCLDRIHVARAFTCFQMEQLLFSAPRDGTPKVVLDLLSTFYDAGVSEADCQRSFTGSLEALRALNGASAVAVSARPPARDQVRRQRLFEQICKATQHVINLEFVQPTDPQPPLF